MAGPVGRAAAAGAGLGLAAGAATLATIVAGNRYFADSALLGLALFGLLPALAGAAFGAAIGAIAGRGRREGAGEPGRGWFPTRALLGVGGVAVAVLATSGAWLPRPAWHTRVLLYGVDAANWAVMDPMIAAGELPALGGLVREGAHGVLMSQEPVISPVVWTNIATGYPREEHGISGFHTRSDDCRRPRLWDIFASRGDVVGTYKFLVTWPPQDLKGFQVPGWLAQGPETTPEDLSFVKRFEMGNRQKHDRKGQNASGLAQQWAFVRDGVAHGLRLSTVARAVGFVLRTKLVAVTPDEGFYRMNLIRADIDRDLFVALMDRFDPAFATFTYYGTDALAHRFWKYFEPEGFDDVKPEDLERYRDVVPAAYRQADRILAELLQRLPEDAHVVVVSDHGMDSATAGTGKPAFGLTTTGIQRFLEGRGAKVDVSRVGQKLIVAVKEGGALTPDQAREALEELTYKGEPFIRFDALPEERASEGVLGLALAILDDLRGPIEAGERVEIGGQPGPLLAEMVSVGENQSGVHTLEGILIARGPRVLPAPGRLDPPATLVDVAPTVLALGGMPAAADMPGRVLPFVRGEVPERVASYQALVDRRRFVKVEDDQGGRDALEERLKALGYVSEGAPAEGGAPEGGPAAEGAAPPEGAAPAAGQGGGSGAP